jgi:hypothetical protein
MIRKNIILLISLAITLIGKAQEKDGFGLFTDRDVYVSGETLLAQIYHPDNDQSKIVYLDLVNPFGKRVTGVSIEMKNNQANGILFLPDSLSTGSYLLRAYLKNTKVKVQIIRNIWISNRFNGLEKTSEISFIPGRKNTVKNENGQIKIENLAEVITTNTDASVTIKFDKTILDQIDGPVLVSVAQTNPTFRATSFAWDSPSAEKGITEKKGLILSGTITDKEDQSRVAGATVYMTIPDTIPEFQYYQTQRYGRFYFLLKEYYGPVHAFVQCFGKNPFQRLKINMDEFSAGTDSLTLFDHLPVTDEFKDATTRYIEVVTFQKIFKQSTITESALYKRATPAYPFYGKATHTVDPHLFIDLPDFWEISKELLSGVKFRNYNNEPTLQVFNPINNSYFEETPLTLIDGIPVNDLNIIKKMGTKDIKLIEVCEGERFFGNIRFPGVVAIYTTDADYSKIKETDQFINLNVEALQPPVSVSTPPKMPDHIPDLRQVLLWKPGIKPDETVQISFRTSAILGKYQLMVTGRLKNGSIISTEKQFEIR